MTDGPPARVSVVVELTMDVVTVDVVILLLKVVMDVMKVDSGVEEAEKTKVESESTPDVDGMITTDCELTKCVEDRRIIHSQSDSNCE